MLFIQRRMGPRRICQYQSQARMSVQARNNLIQSQLQMIIMLISVLCKKIKINKQQECTTYDKNCQSQAMKQSTYKKFNQVSLCDDKNCQSTKKHCYEECQLRPVSLCNDKNCQSAKCVHVQAVQSAMPQSNYKKVTHSTQLCRKQIGTQLEVTRNCQDSTSIDWYPSVNENMCPDTVKMQSNHM